MTSASILHTWTTAFSRTNLEFRQVSFKHVHSPFFDLLSLFFLWIQPLSSTHIFSIWVPSQLTHSEIFGTETFLAFFSPLLSSWPRVSRSYTSGWGFCFLLFLSWCPLLHPGFQIICSHTSYYNGYAPSWNNFPHKTPPIPFPPSQAAGLLLLYSNSLTDSYIPLAELELFLCLWWVSTTEHVGETVRETSSKSWTLSTWPARRSPLP